MAGLRVRKQTCAASSMTRERERECERRANEGLSATSLVCNLPPDRQRTIWRMQNRHIYVAQEGGISHQGAAKGQVHWSTQRHANEARGTPGGESQGRCPTQGACHRGSSAPCTSKNTQTYVYGLERNGLPPSAAQGTVRREQRMDNICRLCKPCNAAHVWLCNAVQCSSCSRTKHYPECTNTYRLLRPAAQ